MKTTTQISLSRFMSKILRHTPKEFGLERDERNFVNLDEFIALVRKEFRGHVSEGVILSLLFSSNKGGAPRFEIAGDKVRATYNITRNEESSNE